MSAGLRRMGLALIAVLAPVAIAAQERTTVTPDVGALIGLARTARDQGRYTEAAARFREASSRHAFDRALLVEYFWVAHRADPATARALAAQILASTPYEPAVRDGWIGLLVTAHDEPAVRRVAQAGATVEPRSALWIRRLAESWLRAGDGRRAADAYRQAAALDGGTPSDLANRALALERAAAPAVTLRAWNDAGAAAWTSRPEWAASRARVDALVRAGRRTRPAIVPSPSDSDVASADSPRVLDACAVAPLSALERLPAPDAFLAALRQRTPSCADEAEWLSRGAERVIGAGRFAEALELVERAGSSIADAVALREQYGVLLHWTGQDERARPILERLVAEHPDRGRAADALVDVLRGAGETDAAWTLAVGRWDGPETALDRRIALAELALETGRTIEAAARAATLTPAAALDPDASARVLAVTAGALLAEGRASEARRRLGALAWESAGTALPWLDAVAATDGVAAALHAADARIVPREPAWADVAARRAVWLAQLGRHREADAVLAAWAAVAPDRIQLARAEVVLALGRTADAEALLRPLVIDHPGLFRARDVLATALAEQGQWDEAFALLETLQRQRPDDARFPLRAAEWRQRQAPSVSTLQALEAAVAAMPALGEGRSALARGYFRAGRYDQVRATLAAVRPPPDHDLTLLARAFRAGGALDEALAALESRATPTMEMRLLHAEIVAARSGLAAADAELERLTASDDPDPAWFLAWADLHRDGAGQRRVLERAAARLPGDPIVQERRALAAWAVSDLAAASAASTAALALDRSRTGAWFVRLELARDAHRRDDVERLLASYASTFAASPSALLGLGDLISAQARDPQDVAAREALAWTDRLLAARPDHAAARLTQARLLASLGQTAGALVAIRTLTARDALPQAFKLEAELLAASGRYADATMAYAHYFARVPNDLPARRQQARVEGWRGARDASLALYERLVADAPSVPAIGAEAEAKRAYYAGDWQTAVARYDAWLALEPEDVEARLERAQSLDHLGDAVAAREAYDALASGIPANRVAAEAAARIARRAQPSVDLFSTSSTADGPARRQELDVIDAGVGVSDGLGDRYAARVRGFAGPSAAFAEGRGWSGYHLGAEGTAPATRSIDLSGLLAVRTLDGAGSHWYGDTRASWRLSSRLQASAGVERTLILENAATLTTGLAGVGPRAQVRWRPTQDFTAEVTATHRWLNDDNRQSRQSLSAAQRVWHRTSELWVVGSTEHLAYAASRPDYFSPSSFWRHDAGLEWRQWLHTPQFFGDKERWLSGAYLLGTDSRHERYQTARIGLAYELANGVGAVADALMVRSRVYDGTRLTLGVRLKHVPMPAR